MGVPICPVAEHAGSEVVRAGWYGKPSHRRQRWWCRPTNGDPKHRFTPVLTRQGEPHLYCVECSTALERWEGQAGARDYWFVAREVGEALAAVARGASYRAAAEAARRRAGRRPENPTEWQWRRRDPARDGQLVANWVDVLSDAVCAGELPGRWADTLLVDSKNFRITTGERTGRGFHVFAALGSEPSEPGKWRPAPKLWRLEPFPRKDLPAWKAFLCSLQGAPRVIVSDADGAIARAIEDVFGNTVEHRQCEWHLGRKLRDHLPDAALRDPLHPITLAVKWLDTFGPQIEAQAATRDANAPNATGPVEDVLDEIDRRLRDRVGSFTNRARMTKLLNLMTLDLTGKADGRDWADRLRERLYLAGGHSGPRRPHDDPKGVHSLLN